MNLVDWRSSTWNTIARLRSRPRRPRCSRAICRSRSTGSASAGDAVAAVRDRLPHRPLEDRDQQVVLAPEVEVDGAGGDAGGARDVGDLGVEEAARGEGVDGGAQDGVALVRAFGRAVVATARRGAVTVMNECSFIRPGRVNRDS